MLLSWWISVISVSSTIGFQASNSSNFIWLNALVLSISTIVAFSYRPYRSNLMGLGGPVTHSKYKYVIILWLVTFWNDCRIKKWHSTDWFICCIHPRWMLRIDYWDKSCDEMLYNCLAQIGVSKVCLFLLYYYIYRYARYLIKGFSFSILELIKDSCHIVISVDQMVLFFISHFNQLIDSYIIYIYMT